MIHCILKSETIPLNHTCLWRENLSALSLPTLHLVSGKKKKDIRKKAGCCLEMNSLGRCSFVKKCLAGLGWLGKYRTRNCQPVFLFFKSPRPWFGKNLYHFFLFCFYLFGILGGGVCFLGFVCLLAFVNHSSKINFMIKKVHLISIVIYSDHISSIKKLCTQFGYLLLTKTLFQEMSATTEHAPANRQVLRLTLLLEWRCAGLSKGCWHLSIPWKIRSYWD